MKFIFAILLFSSLSIHAQQCIYINEVMVNGPGGCDGSCSPSTEEWTELYNSCNNPIDLSCYVLTDGDFTVTFPSGTTIPANGFITIGSPNSGILIDIDISSCSCTSGGGVGIFTNGNEQLILNDNNGVLVDAVVWGTGQFPISISSGSIGSCTSQIISYASVTSDFEPIGSSSNNGCTRARACDGSSIWLERCTTTITGHSSNGIPIVPNFTISEDTICSGSCISFTDNSTGSPNNWQWSFVGADITSSSTQNPTSICYSNNGLFDVELTVDNGCGPQTLTLTNAINVSQIQPPSLVASGALTFCNSNSIQLTVPNTFTSYQWYQNNTLIPNANSNQLSVNTSGNYYVNVTQGLCSVNSDTLTTSVQLAPISLITNGGSNIICNGGSALLSAINLSTNYQWLLGGSPISGATSSSYLVTTVGNYSLIQYNLLACSDTSNIISITNSSSSNPIINSALGSFTFCEGIANTLSITGNYSSYEWYLNNQSVSSQSVLNVSISGNYFVIVQDANGCIDTSNTTIINILPSPSINLFPTDTTICTGDSATLVASSTQNYQWYYNNSIINGAILDSYLASQSGNYYVVGTSANNCTDTSNISSIQFFAPNNLSIQSPSNSICDGDNLQLSINNAAQVLWSTNETTNSISINDAGDYSVVITDINNCVAYDTISIIKIQVPVADAGIDQTIPCNGSTSLNGTGGNQLLWQPSLSLSSASISNPIANPSISTTYTLTVNNQNCSSTDEVIINVEPCSNIFFPNTFSPNGDNLNDVFRPLGNDIAEYELRIFNRWGELIFQSNNPKIGWDGSQRNQEAAIGVYVYVFIAKDSAGNELLFNGSNSGNITLIR